MGAGLRDETVRAAAPRYRRMSLVSNIATTFAARVAMLGLAFVSSIMLARLLGPEGRGTLALVCLLPDVAAILGRLGFDSANTVLAGLDPARRRLLVWQSVALAGGMGGAMAIGGGRRGSRRGPRLAC